jgi:hypothetical protein
MRTVVRTPAGGPYRDEAPGIQARLTDLRAAWIARSAEVRASGAADVRRLATAIGRCRGLALAQVLLVAVMLTFWLHRLVAAFDLPPQKCGNEVHGVLPATFLVFALLLVPLRALAVRLELRRARAREDRALALVVAGGADVAAQIEHLAGEHPATRHAAFVAQLEQQRRLWSLIARGLVLVIVPFLMATSGADPAAVVDAACLAVFPLIMLVLGVIAAGASRRASGWRGVALVGLAIALTYVASFFHPAASLLALLQLWVVVHGLTRR